MVPGEGLLGAAAMVSDYGDMLEASLRVVVWGLRVLVRLRLSERLGRHNHQ